MRILVAGASGQLAKALLDTAGGRHDVTALGRPTLDLKDAASVARAVTATNPDAIINAGAYTAVDKAETEEPEATAVNVGSANLAREAARRDIPFLHVSTDYVFDGKLDRPYRESDPVGPVGAYGRSKLAAEEAVAAADPRALTLRTAWVYYHEGANFVRTMLRLAETRDELNVVADQIGCPTYAADLAEGLLKLAELRVADGQKQPGGVYHLTGSGETSWHNFATAIFAGAAKRGFKVPAKVNAIPTSGYPTPAVRPANSRLDCSLIEKTYGVRLPVWPDALERCLNAIALHKPG
ncbi:MAG: dTDP-4-dehydrorhamnose reductase [Alphaproteobacteria bacterium]|nr:dTDP-4-dehydrorhamnose reductase [Alphaproteobacteria bacterium]